MTAIASRLDRVVLDTESLTSVSPYVEADREQAIADLAAENHFAPLLCQDATGPFVLYLSIFAVTRIVTEFWKLFVRVEPQEGFRIPTQIHCVTGVVHDPSLRLLMGAGFLASIYGIGMLGRVFPDGWSPALHGLVAPGLEGYTLYAIRCSLFALLQRFDPPNDRRFDL